MKILGKLGVRYGEAIRKQRGNDGSISREARFLYMLKRGFGAISSGKQSDQVAPLCFLKGKIDVQTTMDFIRGVFRDILGFV